MVIELAVSMFSDATWVKVKYVLNSITAEQAGKLIDDKRSDSDCRFISILDL